MPIADNLQEKIVKNEDIFKIFYSSITFLSVDFWRRKRREKTILQYGEKMMEKDGEKARKDRKIEMRRGDEDEKGELLRINWQRMKLKWADRGDRRELGRWREAKGNKSRGGKW